MSGGAEQALLKFCTGINDEKMTRGMCETILSRIESGRACLTHSCRTLDQRLTNNSEALGIDRQCELCPSHLDLDPDSVSKSRQEGKERYLKPVKKIPEKNICDIMV
jgi:hypothetical protein